MRVSVEIKQKIHANVNSGARGHEKSLGSGYMSRAASLGCASWKWKYGSAFSAMQDWEPSWFMVFLWGRGSSGSWGELNTCTDAHGVSVCVIRRSGKKNQHFILSLNVFLVSWQREMQSKVRKYQEVPAHPATGQHKGYGPLLTLQSNCPLLPVLPGMTMSPPERKLGCSCNAKPWVANSHAQPSLTASQGCTQRLITLPLRPDQLLHVTVLRSLSRGNLLKQPPDICRLFSWVTSSGPVTAVHWPGALFGSLQAKPRSLKGTDRTDTLSQTCSPAHSPGQHRVAKAGRLCKEAAWAVCIFHADGTWEAPKTQHNLMHPFPGLLFTPGVNGCVGRQRSCCVHSLSPSCLVLPSRHISADFVFL